jgi:deazaflavin-dependent oxidoreductase (nitroreductase family)
MDMPAGPRSVRLAVSLLRTRWLVRAPIWIFRCRLGFVFGGRFLLLEHTGRRTGRSRHVVLEVVDRRPPGALFVVSGLGRRSAWFRNIVADPRVRVQTGIGPPRPADAHELEPAAARLALSRYAADHPSAWRQLQPVLEAASGARVAQAGSALPVVELRLERPVR